MPEIRRLAVFSFDELLHCWGAIYGKAGTSCIPVLFEVRWYVSFSIESFIMLDGLVYIYHAS